VAENARRRVFVHAGVAGRRAIPVGLVVACRWDGKPFRARPLTPGLGTLELISHAVSARRSPGAALQAIRSVVSTAPVIEQRTAR
jgi:hypothetical protein